MSLTLQLRKTTKFRVQQKSNTFKLDIEILTPDWVSVFVNKKFMDLGTFTVSPNILTFTEEIDSGAEIVIKDFEIGKKKKRKEIRSEDEADNNL